MNYAASFYFSVTETGPRVAQLLPVRYLNSDNNLIYNAINDPANAH